LDYPQKY